MTSASAVALAPAFAHVPVLAEAVQAALQPAPGRVIVDGTLGGAGHTRALLSAGAAVYGIDQDPAARAHVQALELPGLTVLAGNFRDMAALLGEHGVTTVDGVLLDIGVSSHQLDTVDRGFSYHGDAPLDMRMSGDGPTAADFLAEAPMEEIAAVIYRYSEELNSRRIARAIVEARAKEPLVRTAQLAEVIRRAVGHTRGIHPARRTFQALRVHVNDELGALRAGLDAAAGLLRPGGVLAVITFHSLEDRVVKRFGVSDPRVEPLTRKPVIAGPEELEANPRARSAKLRALRRLP